MTPTEGVDYSYSPPSTAGLVAAGKTFAVRYGAPGNAGKFLTAAEVARLHTAGLAIVANVEEDSGGYRGAAAGVRWATVGDAFFRKLGMPADRPIYFSVDWAAGPADWPDVDAALRGSASVLGPGRVGVYGSYDVIAHCAAAGTAAWFWQTYAWSNDPNTGKTRWYPAAHLQQYRNNVALAGGTVDLTRAVTTDYGQWGGGDMAWVLVPSLIALRAEFNAIAPNRDKASDGSIGDAAHQAEVSDHNPDETGNTGSSSDTDSINEVHAIDIDSTGPWPPACSLEQAVQHIVGEHKAGRDNRLKYVIYNRRIWALSSGWVQQAYTGADPHTNHAHFSARYGSGAGTSNPENDTHPYGLQTLGEDMPLDPTDLTKIADIVDKAVAKYVGDVVPRFDANGAPVPADDPNPKMYAFNALGYLSRDTTLIRQSLAALQKQTPGPVVFDQQSLAVLATSISDALLRPLVNAIVGALEGVEPVDLPRLQAVVETGLRNVLLSGVGTGAGG